MQVSVSRSRITYAFTTFGSLRPKPNGRFSTSLRSDSSGPSAVAMTQCDRVIHCETKPSARQLQRCQIMCSSSSQPRNTTRSRFTGVCQAFHNSGITVANSSRHQYARGRMPRWYMLFNSPPTNTTASGPLVRSLVILLIRHGCSSAMLRLIILCGYIAALSLGQTGAPPHHVPTSSTSRSSNTNSSRLATTIHGAVTYTVAADCTGISNCTVYERYDVAPSTS